MTNYAIAIRKMINEEVVESWLHCARSVQIFTSEDLAQRAVAELQRNATSNHTSCQYSVKPFPE